MSTIRDYAAYVNYLYEVMYEDPSPELYYEITRTYKDAERAGISEEELNTAVDNYV